MIHHYPLYKGLSQPLVYRGLKGKFIYWAIASLAMALVFGCLVASMVNVYLGCFLILTLFALGLTLTFLQQKRGLHPKNKEYGVYVREVRLKITYHYE